MEDIDKAISTTKKQMKILKRKLKGKFEDLNLEQDMEKCDMLSLDHLIEQTKDLVIEVKGIDLDEKRGVTIPTSKKLAGEIIAIRKMEKIYDLINGDVTKIGVYGMGGIGKTTVMKHINNRILKEKKDKFDIVIWLNVSKERSIFKLQDDIACKLEVNLSKYKDTTTKAGKLFEAFQRKGRYLLILDDLWEEFSLEDVGIPDPNDANGCKLVLTTRSFDVCQRMECEAIKMDLLSKEEAWSLFLDHVGLDELQVKGLEPIVQDVASECACLPLAIVTIARSMKGKKELCEWRVVLAKLRVFSEEPGDKGEKVIKQLKFSYDYLKDEKLKKCLLLCALYPEDKEIKRTELIELLALEGIIKEKESKRDEIDEGNAMLNDLINQCLLEGEITSKEDSWVKMHDLVRDMTLQIDGLHSKYLTVSGTELSNVKKLNHVKCSKELLKIYISNCYFLNVSPKCRGLTTFILQDDSLTNIPDSFFQHFKALKVLYLFGCKRLEVLPNSISNLENLVGLVLRNCHFLRYVPSLARLKNLQTLEFSLTKVKISMPVFEVFYNMIPIQIAKLPKGLEKLRNLRYLNLMVFRIEVFPRGIIPKLSNLRYLVCNPLTKVSASELKSLKKIEMFKGAFYDINDLCVYVKHTGQKSSGLFSYFFFVGPHYQDYMDTPGVKGVHLENCNLGKLAAKNDEYLLPKDVQMLIIQSVRDLTSLCALASLNSARDLRECLINHCHGVRELVSTSSSSSFVLPSLEKLHLVDMENLEALIGRKKKACNVFSCLRKLKIRECNRMKVVINIGLLSNLNNLEELTVMGCKEVEEIIGEGLDDEKDVNEGITQNTLPKLKHLELEDLPHLRCISLASRPLICKSLQVLHLIKCPRLKVAFNIGLLSNLNNLEELKVDSCKELEEIIGEWVDEEKDVNEGITQITLPNLRTLRLSSLPDLRSICPPSRPLICKFLERIYIEDCPVLEQLVYVAWERDEIGRPSPSASLQPIELKSPMEKFCKLN